jgi:glutamyl-tRNA synthetase
MVAKKNQKPMRVRFAPSPTGITHLGSGRTALYNYLLAQQSGGQFILRIEDTDQKRYDPDAEKDLIDSLHWLGLQWDEGPDVGGPHEPYRQSERKHLYQETAHQLINTGDAFYCFCTRNELEAERQAQLKRKESPRYSGKCRNLDPTEARRRVEAGEEHVIRFKMPQQGTTVVTDRLRGEIRFDNALLDDYILVKSDGLAVYHLAAMVDDHLMGITHVLRGEEWIPTFPLHANIYRALGWDQPEWVHLSLFLKPSGKGKMSKRDTEQMRLSGESIFIRDMRSMGYLPEAVINWVVLMGWSFDDHQEFFTLGELIEKFSLDKLSPKNAAIDFKKLDHFNGLHIRNLEVSDLAQRIRPYIEAAGYRPEDGLLLKAAPLIQPRLVTLDDAAEWIEFLLTGTVELEADQLVAKGLSAEQSAEIARRSLAILESTENIEHDTLEAQFRDLVEELGYKAGQVFGILRIAITGQQVSPPLFESMEIIGIAQVRERVRHAVALLENLS